MIIQWGYGTITNSGYFEINFSISVSHICYINAISRNDAYDNYYRHQIISVDSTSAKIRDTNASANTPYFWFAIGY